MGNRLQKIKDRFNLEIESPFKIQVEGKEHSFDCLIRGYGAENGMIIDKDWDKISVIEKQLVDMNYGYSCFEIDRDDDDIESFKDVLYDWGKISN